MNEVTITIGRRSYTVACAPGQEEHVRAMAAEVDERLRRLAGNQSTNDAKNMLFAAIILADELFETRRDGAARAATTDENASAEPSRERLALLEEDLADAREEQERLRQHLANANDRLARRDGSGEAEFANEGLAVQLENLAAALEKSASLLEGDGTTH